MAADDAIPSKDRGLGLDQVESSHELTSRPSASSPLDTEEEPTSEDEGRASDGESVRFC